MTEVAPRAAGREQHRVWPFASSSPVTRGKIGALRVFGNRAAGMSGRSGLSSLRKMRDENVPDQRVARHVYCVLNGE